jgi:hypothetical protein
MGTSIPNLVQNGVLSFVPMRSIDTRTLEIGVFLFQVPESFSEPRLLGFLLDLTFDRAQFFVGLRRLASVGGVSTSR